MLRIPHLPPSQLQGATNDCGPYCAAIMLNFAYRTKRFRGHQVARDMNRSLRYRWPGWATWPWGMVRYLREHGLQARFRIGVSEDALQRYLHQKRPVIVLVGGWPAIQIKLGRLRAAFPKFWRLWAHYKILVGFHPDKGYLFVDPQFPQPVLQPRHDFLHQWRFCGQMVIEVETRIKL